MCFLECKKQTNYTVLVVLSLLVTPVSAVQKQFNWFGDLGYSFLSVKTTSAADKQQHTEDLRLNVVGYLYQPWLATFSSNVTLSFKQVDTDTDSDTDNISGGVDLRFFPKSRFPLALYFDKADSQTDTDLTAFVLKRTRYGFNQQYTGVDGLSLSFGYDHSTQTSVGSGAALNTSNEIESESFKTSLNKSFNDHEIVFDANLNRVENMAGTNLTETAFSTLRHAYRPSSRFYSEDVLTLNQGSFELTGSNSKTEAIQLSSTGFWKPRTIRPLRISGTIRGITSTEENQFSESTISNLSSTLGATYDLSSRWSMRGNIGFVTVDAATKSKSSFESIEAAYKSRKNQLFDFDASWYAQFNLQNNKDDVNNIQEAGMGLGYNLNRSFDTKKKQSLSLRISQSVNALADTDTFSSQALLTNLSLSGKSEVDATSNMARLSISDSRTFANGPASVDVEGNFQIVNFQASADHKLSRRSSVSGNVTMQATRHSKPFVQGVIDLNNGDWQPTSTIDVAYYRNSLFLVPRLSFHSTLRYMSDTYIPVVSDLTGDSTNRNERLWENRLDYSLGRLKFSAISRLSKIQQEEQNYFLLQVRRMLGGY